MSTLKIMNIGSFDFYKVCDISLYIDEDGSIKEYMPQSRYENYKSLPLNNYGQGPFCKFKIPRNLRTSGVYALIVNDDIKYIGESVDLSSRYNAGYGNISPKNCFKGENVTIPKYLARIAPDELRPNHCPGNG